MKNDVRNYLTRLIDNVAKESWRKNTKREEKDKTEKKQKSKTNYCMSSEKTEAWSKNDGFKCWDTADGKPLKDKNTCVTRLEVLDLSETLVCLQ